TPRCSNGWTRRGAGTARRPRCRRGSWRRRSPRAGCWARYRRGADQHELPLVSAPTARHPSVRKIQTHRKGGTEVTEGAEESRRRADRARQVALFRYALIQDVPDPELSARQRGALVRELAGRDHDGPAGQQIRGSQQTIRRWGRDWRAGGVAGPVPP